MLTDGDGRPIPPVGSKVRFCWLSPGHNVQVYEGVITERILDREDQSLNCFKLAEGFKKFRDKEWTTGTPSRAGIFYKGVIEKIFNVTVLEPIKGITDDGIKNSEGPDFSNFFLADFLADLKLTCGGQTFHVHRVLLAAASPYFQAMFQNEMIEANSGGIELREIKSDVLKTVLEFLYKNKIDLKDFKEDPDFAGDLLAAADMYQLKNLKRIAEDELCDNLQLENVLELVVIADRHGATKLKEKALKMIVEKKEQVENVDDWCKFIGTYPKLTAEIIKMLK